MWNDILKKANTELAKHNIKICVEQNDNDLYSVWIEYNGWRFYFACNYDSENLFYYQVLGAIYHAHEMAFNDGDEFVSYRKIHGDTHGEPAIVLAFSNDIDVYFRNKENGTMELVQEIDDYDEAYYAGIGEFYVRTEDYEKAMRVIEAND